MCARRRSNFLSRRRKKVTKERATLLCVSLRCATGNLRCSGRGCAAELTARCALRSNSCGKSVHEVRVSFGTRTHPLPCASRHAQKGTQRTATRAFASLGLAVAARSARGLWAERSKGPCGCSAVPPLLAAPAAGRLRGEHGRRSAHASLTDSPGMAERRAQRKASSTAHPAAAPTQVCPNAARRWGRRLGGAFSLVTFFWRSKRKLLAAGRLPASALCTGTPLKSAREPWLRKAQPERVARINNLPK